VRRGFGHPFLPQRAATVGSLPLRQVLGATPSRLRSQQLQGRVYFLGGPASPQGLTAWLHSVAPAHSAWLPVLPPMLECRLGARTSPQPACMLSGRLQGCRPASTAVNEETTTGRVHDNLRPTLTTRSQMALCSVRYFTQVSRTPRPLADTATGRGTRMPLGMHDGYFPHNYPDPHCNVCVHTCLRVQPTLIKYTPTVCASNCSCSSARLQVQHPEAESHAPAAWPPSALCAPLGCAQCLLAWDGAPASWPTRASCASMGPEHPPPLGAATS
jgi:hypothetical protein